MTLRALALAGLLLLTGIATPIASQTNVTVTEPVETTALAVARTETGVEGASASITVTVAPNGSGHVFVETRPLTGPDMQGSARIAARVAASVTGYSFEAHDFFYAIRSDSPMISGPSAGGELALAATAALENAHRGPEEPRWNVSDEVMATGTISPDGTIGPVGGILTKAKAATQAGAELFLLPEGQDPYQPRLQPVVAEHGQAAVNVSSYCREELGITCREVSTIEQLVTAATGHRFEQPQLGEPPSTSGYADTLAPLSEDLIDEARGVHDTWAKLNASDLDPEAHATVEEAIQRSLAPQAKASEHLAEDRFYSAASLAFQSSVNARNARLLLTFFQEDRSLDRIETAIETSADRVASARQAARNASVDGIHDLYTVGAAQERVSSAEQRLDQARAALNVTTIDEALYQAAFAHERAETVHWWLSLGEAFPPGPQLPRNVSALAQEFVDVGDEMLVYAGSVVGKRGGLEGASQRLHQAKQDGDRGFHAAALLEAAEAQVLATLPLELREGPAPEGVNESRREAIEAIQKARGRGVEPILPIAMFEFGDNQDRPGQAMRLLRQARVLAGISSVLTGEADPAPSAFVGEPDPPELEGDRNEGSSEQEPSGEEAAHGDAETHAGGEPVVYAHEVGWFIAGFFAAIVVGLAMAAGSKG